MLEEVLAWLAPRPGGVFVDATVGGGGHAEAILERVVPGGLVIGIDRDPDALVVAARRLARFGSAVRLRHANYAAIRQVVAEAGIGAVDGIVMDLGTSSLQLETAERGFSFLRPGPLDMRMDRGEPQTAADLVNTLREEDLADLIRRYGEERWARRIARAIIARRPLATTDELAAVVADAIPRRAWPRGLHPATRTFQALRIAVNRELEHLERALPDAVGTLRGGGRLCVITFHSLEDRLVKHTFLRLSRGCTCPPGSPTCTCGGRRWLRVLTRTPQTPSAEEIARNPRARSAKLRVAERLSGDGSTDAPEAGQRSAGPTLPSILPDASPPAPGFRRAGPRRGDAPQS
jgi:16S rRNA (cytosine1402-N4)-methyltransferase